MKLVTGNQTHRIKRLLFELNIEQQTQAHSVHTEVSRICHNRIEALLEQCLKKSAIDSLYRIDTLELDLGSLDPANLEQDIMQQLEQELHRVLPGQLKQSQSDGQQEIDSSIQSRLELLDVYARQGHLPWWAGHSQAEPLSATVEELLDKAPGALLRVMPSLVRDERALARIASRCDDALLIRLGKRICPPQAAALNHFPNSLTELLHRAARESLRATSGQEIFPSLIAHPRRYVWQALLQTMVSAPVSDTDTAGFWREVILRIAVITGARYNRLVTGLQHGLAKGAVGSFPTTLRELLTIFYREASPTKSSGKPVTGELSDAATSDSSITRAGRTQRPHDLNDLNRTPTAGKPAGGEKNSEDVDAEQDGRQSDIFATQERGADWAAVIGLLQDLAVQDQQDLLRMEQALQIQVEALIKAAHVAMPDMAERLYKYKSVWRARLTPAQCRGFEALLSGGQRGTLSAASGASVRPGVEKGANASTIKNTIEPAPLFSHFEEAYVENAGLAILGPFLERFFTRQELLLERRFRDKAAAQRAVSLLQYLANEDPLGPEYLLPLNKILCGIAPDAVFDDGPPLREEEQAECQQLLQAIIEHASILRKMSVAGFRSSFLLRKGLLESRDGAWLLRVERETYDVVLDRFPWSFSWLKLPWMKAPLRVEW